MVKIWKNLETWWQENYCIQLTVRIGNFFPVLFLIILVGWSYYAFVIRLCISYLLNSYPVQGVVYLLIYHPLFLLMMWSYFKATFMSPGYSTDTRLASVDSSTTTYIPLDQRRSNSGETTSSNVPESSNVPSNQGQQGGTQQRKKDNILVVIDENGSPISRGSIMVKQSGEKRFCQKCNFDKPDRAHHCRVCKECILKMDHHCPWLNNCIGHRNQKPFYLFLLWATLYSFFISTSTLIPIIKYAESTEEPVIEIDLNWTFLILLGGVFFLCLIGFTIFHTGLILSNQTTLESLQKHNYKVRENGDVTTSKYLNLFDIGRKNNWIQVMGPKWYFWFIPIGDPFNDGKSWPLNSYRYSTLCDSVENLNNPAQILIHFRIRMGENRLQYKLLHKMSEQKLELSKPQSSLDKEKVSQLNQETEEILHDLDKPDKKVNKLTEQKLEHLKRFIDEIKAETQLVCDEKFQKSRTKENKRKEEPQPRSVPTLLVDLRKPFNKWDVINNPRRQEFNSEINSTYKSMWSVIDKIK